MAFRKRCKFLVLWGAAPLVLSGCAGGGGGGGGTEDAVLSDGSNTVIGPRTIYENEEYRRSTGLAMMGASWAYARCATGQGIKVGVLDTGIDLDHPDLAGAIDPASKDVTARKNPTVDDKHGHGTWVAGVVAARRNGIGTHGIAYRSKVLAIRVDDPNSSGRAYFLHSDVVRGTDYGINQGARVLNYSMGGSSISSDFADALARAAAANIVVVAAAGNDSAANPSLPGAYATSSRMQGRMIVAGAVDSTGKIAGFSNRAGTAKNYYLTAPGVGIRTTAVGGGTTTVNGTSFASPYIAGAAALVLDNAPHLKAEQVVSLLLKTAKDLGAPGVDSVYGNGLVDLQAALSPQGTPRIATGASADGPAVALADTELRMGPAFGDALSGTAFLDHAVFLDSYGRAYQAALGDRVHGESGGINLESWLAPDRRSVSGTHLTDGGAALTFTTRAEPETRILADPTVSQEPKIFAMQADLGGGTRVTASRGLGLMAETQPASEPAMVMGGSAYSPFLAMMDQGDGLSIAQELGNGWAATVGAGLSNEEGLEGDGRRTLGALGLSHAWSEGTRLGVQFGRMEERDGLLTGSGRGAFAAGDGAGSRFVTVYGEAPAGPLNLHASFTWGETDAPASANSLLRDFSTIGSSAWAVGASMAGVFDPTDRIGFSVSSPLRVTSGDVLLDIPTGRNADGSLSRAAERVSLVPSGREIDLELGYGRMLADGTQLQFNAGTRLEPGHDAGERAEHLFGIRLRRPL